MILLGIDIGSSSVKAALLRDGRVAGRIARAPFPSRFGPATAEVNPAAILRALAAALADLGPAIRRVDAIGLTHMAPSWVAMDSRGKPRTPIITHQDRRSVQVALDLESRVGAERHLALAGNRPFPGGISSTTWRWHIENAPERIAGADLVGHLNTFLHRHLTSARVTDPSNASFMGLFSTLDLAGWSDELCEAVGARRDQLPEILDANVIAGHITPAAATRFGLADGTPMMTGCMDGSAAMFLAGARPGQLVDVCGTTDVLALCTDRPRPHPRLLTRALGVGRRWMSVSTLAAAGSALLWAHQQLFPDLALPAFQRLLARLAARPNPSTVRFDPSLAGDRMSIEQRQGSFTGLTLSTTREHMLAAIIEALATASAERLPLLRQGGTPIRRDVIISGGLDAWLGNVLHRDWPGRWRFHPQPEATLRGLAHLKIVSGRVLRYQKRGF